MEISNADEEVYVRLPQEEYRWTLYDYAVAPDGFRAVYKHDSGAWAAFRPYVSPPVHEVQIYSPSTEQHDRLDADTESLIHLIEQGVPIRLRDSIEEGNTEEAYNFALLN
jgi:hypothetical protein